MTLDPAVDDALCPALCRLRDSAHSQHCRKHRPALSVSLSPDSSVTATSSSSSSSVNLMCKWSPVGLQVPACKQSAWSCHTPAASAFPSVPTATSPLIHKGSSHQQTTVLHTIAARLARMRRAALCAGPSLLLPSCCTALPRTCSCSPPQSQSPALNCSPAVAAGKLSTAEPAAACRSPFEATWTRSVASASTAPIPASPHACAVDTCIVQYHSSSSIVTSKASPGKAIAATADMSSQLYIASKAAVATDALSASNTAVATFPAPLLPVCTSPLSTAPSSTTVSAAVIPSTAPPSPRTCSITGPDGSGSMTHISTCHSSPSVTSTMTQWYRRHLSSEMLGAGLSSNPASLWLAQAPPLTSASRRLGGGVQGTVYATVVDGVSYAVKVLPFGVKSWHWAASEALASLRCGEATPHTVPTLGLHIRPRCLLQPAAPQPVINSSSSSGGDGAKDAAGCDGVGGGAGNSEEGIDLPGGIAGMGVAVADDAACTHELLLLMPLAECSLDQLVARMRSAVAEEVCADVAHNSSFRPHPSRRMKGRGNEESALSLTCSSPGCRRSSHHQRISSSSAMEEDEEDEEPELEVPPYGVRLAAQAQATGGILCMLCDVALGLAGVHALSMTHGDVKPENVMCFATAHGAAAGTGVASQSSSGSSGACAAVSLARPSACLGDFGHAQRFEAGSSSSHLVGGLFVGTLLYTAPECVAAPIAHLSPASDIFSFGLLAAEVLEGVCDEVLVVTLPYVIQLLARCLDYDPAERPTAVELATCLAEAAVVADTSAAAHFGLPSPLPLPTTTTVRRTSGGGLCGRCSRTQKGEASCIKGGGAGAAAAAAAVLAAARAAYHRSLAAAADAGQLLQLLPEPSLFSEAFSESRSSSPDAIMSLRRSSMCDPAGRSIRAEASQASMSAFGFDASQRSGSSGDGGMAGGFIDGLTAKEYEESYGDCGESLEELRMAMMCRASQALGGLALRLQLRRAALEMLRQQDDRRFVAGMVALKRFAVHEADGVELWGIVRAWRKVFGMQPWIWANFDAAWAAAY